MSGTPNPYQNQGQPSVQLPNYLVQSILVTLFCCIPFGIVAIVYSAGVNGKLASGDVAGAQAASQAAKKWCWIGFGSGLAVNLIVIVIQIIAVVAAVGQNAGGPGY